MQSNQRLFLKKTHYNTKNSETSIPSFINPNYTTGDNKKYMKMYNWMAFGYDFAEKVIGKLKFGQEIIQMRRYMMQQLEWQNNLNVLYVSIGTGTDLEYIPKNIEAKSLNIIGVDISLGMLQKCQKKFKNHLNLHLVHCCAEDLPFEDNSFDIVFHVGGINFFNDKKLAIDEMIRVAKPNSKILIADETNDLINKQYKSNRFSKKYFENTHIELSEIENLIPSSERKTEFLWDGKFYCITFRK